MEPEKLAAAAVSAILVGTDLTLTLPDKEKWPNGWPRGELLSVNPKTKMRNYSFNPLKVLAFMQKIGKLSNFPHENDKLYSDNLRKPT